MLLQVLLICLKGLVYANATDDVGEIPYENQVIPRASPILAVSPLDYGDVPYEKGPLSKSDDYGNIPYEAGTVVLKPRVDVDYGNIPYEKVLGMTTREDNTSINIPGILQDLLGGREVPGATKATQFPSAATARNLTELATITESIETTIEMRAKKQKEVTEDLGEYRSPGTIDDWDCRVNCSTCRDAQGYRVYCLNGTTTKAPSDIRLVLNVLVKITDIYWSNNDTLLISNFERSLYEAYPGGWPVCPTTTSTTDTPSPTDAPSNLTGLLIAKCYVCGMLSPGIPPEDHLCADSFLSHAFKKHCKYLNRDGWLINGTKQFYMWGRWTGGCSLRYVDVSPIYHQRTCRNRGTPAKGSSFVSRRLERLEFALHKEKDGCIFSPTASLVPLSRGISLYSRFHVCVCSQNYCNRAERLSTLFHWHIVLITMMKGFYDALKRNFYVYSI